MKTRLTFPTRLALASILSATLLLAACASNPVTPDWQANGFSALKGFSAAYLNGNARLADFEFARAKTEISSTGRADLLARAELTRCAVRVASLEFDNCAGYQPLAQDAQASEQAYAAYLTGHWTELNTALLPAQHRALVQQAAVAPALTSPTPTRSVLDSLEDPLARLVAAGVLLQNSQLTPADITTATETASGQGWRRPLLAWLEVQRQRVNQTDDRDAVARLQRRIDLVLRTSPKTQ